MTTINAGRLALVFGLFLGGYHLAWALLVAAGWAQPVLDFILRVHFIAPVWTVTPFNLGDAALLVAATGAMGAAAGWLFAVLWNWAVR